MFKIKIKDFKIITIALLILSGVETNFGVGALIYLFNDYFNKNPNQQEINSTEENKTLNENYFIVDDEDNIIIDPQKDEKYSFYLAEHFPENYALITIEEGNSKKYLVSSNNNTDRYIAHENNKIPVKKEDNVFCLILYENEPVEDPGNTIKCKLVKKNVDLDSLNDAYCLGNSENNKIKTILGKKLVFEVLTRNKCLELKNTIKNVDNFLKNEENNIFVNEDKMPLLFEEKDNNIILYVKQKETALSLAVLDNDVAPIENFISVKILKNSEISKNNEFNENNKNGEENNKNGEENNKNSEENNKNSEENDNDPCCNCGCCDKCSENEN